MRVILALPSGTTRRSSPTSSAGAEHIGLASITSYLRQYGHEVVILNFQAQAAFSGRLQTISGTVEKILSSQPEAF